MDNPDRQLSPEASASLLQTLQARFGKHAARHPDIEWAQVASRLEARPDQLWSLAKMERTGGEPDLTGHDAATGELPFCDCAPESPAGRRSLCYDRAGWESRREARPENTALDMAEAMGVEVLTEAQYLDLQRLGEFDLKTSSWLLTPGDMRARGGALFGDRRFGRVFVYHNGAQSYYAGRGFRALLRV